MLFSFTHLDPSSFSNDLKFWTPCNCSKSDKLETYRVLSFEIMKQIPGLVTPEARCPSGKGSAAWRKDRFVLSRFVAFQTYMFLVPPRLLIGHDSDVQIDGLYLLNDWAVSMKARIAEDLPFTPNKSWMGKISTVSSVYFVFSFWNGLCGHCYCIISQSIFVLGYFP